MVMGKGGVGKTTIAAALAVGLVQRGHAVHLSTTDPAAHLAGTLEGELPGLTLSRIDPRSKPSALHRQDHGGQGPKLDAQGKRCCWKTCSPPPKRWRCSTPSHAS